MLRKRASLIDALEYKLSMPGESSDTRASVCMSGEHLDSVQSACVCTCMCVDFAIGGDWDAQGQ